MKVIRQLIDLVLYTSIFTACCATGLCMATEKLVELSSPPLLSWLHILVFGSTLLVYNAPRLATRNSTRDPRDARYHKWYLLFFSLGGAMAGTALYFMPMPIIVVSLVLSIFAFGYFLPLLPVRGKKRLRDFGWLKLLVLAGVWTTATSVLPILFLQHSIADYPFEIILRLAFIFVLCVVFDIRDIQADLELNIFTLPHKVGLKNSYRLINIALILFVALATLQYLRHPAPGRLWGSLATAIITKAMVIYLRNHPSEKGYLLLADGVMLVYALLVLLPPA